MEAFSLLDSVVDLDYTFINGSSVLLTWTAPYTLDNVPITGYYIVNELVNITTTNKSIILSATNPDPCILNNVSVSPINDVGIGLSNNISFYYETVPLVTPPVSVAPVIDGQQLLLNISISVRELCTGEYPNRITANILDTDNTMLDSAGISTQVNDQSMITGVITVPNNLNTFIVNVSLSNNGGEFLPIPSFGFGKVGPVTNIDSLIDNCSTIDITWTAPTVDDGVSILYYILKIYDAITGSLVDTVLVDGTSYQFVDNNLFIHRYTYVITGVNELGEGISNNDTFSYQRVPRSVTTKAASDILSFNETSANVFFNIPVMLECTGEAPANATITIQCTGKGVVFNNTYLVNYSAQPMNITGSALVSQYQQCNISIVFSNEAGSSEPFILAFESTTTPPPIRSSFPSVFIPVIGSLIVVLLFLLAGVAVILCCLYKKIRGKRTLLEKPCDLCSPEPLSGDNSPSDNDKKKQEIIKINLKRDDAAITDKDVEKYQNITKVAAKDPIYLDLGIPLTGTDIKPSAKTEGSVQYTDDIESVRPKSKVPSVQSSDDEMLSPNDALIIGATGGDTNLLSLLPEKSKGTATTAQEVDGRNYVAEDLPHDKDLQFSSLPPPHVSVGVQGKMGRRKEAGSAVANIPVVVESSYL
uniref:Fibronectin type-III domain-containing protein n=2 Tax=Amphimedon queenslandica TaxID=400682 RepID=A0A1X7V596_AMPQE